MLLDLQGSSLYHLTGRQVLRWSVARLVHVEETGSLRQTPRCCMTLLVLRLVRLNAVPARHAYK